MRLNMRLRIFIIYTDIVTTVEEYQSKIKFLISLFDNILVDEQNEDRTICCFSAALVGRH